MSAYIYTKIKEIAFSLPYSDGSGDRVVVKIDGKMLDVQIHGASDYVLIAVEDIEWLRQSLLDVQNLLKIGSVETKKTNQ